VEQAFKPAFQGWYQVALAAEVLHDNPRNQAKLRRPRGELSEVSGISVMVKLDDFPQWLKPAA
jgi:hypothetical protein